MNLVAPAPHRLMAAWRSDTTRLAISRAGAQALTYTTTILLARAISVEDYGRFAFAQAVASIFAMWVDHGGQFQLVQVLSRPGAETARLVALSARARWVLALAAVPLCAVLWWTAPHDPRRAQVAALSLLGATADGMLYLAFACFRSQGRLAREAWWTAAASAVRTGLVVAALALHAPLLSVLSLIAAGKWGSMWLARRESARATTAAVASSWGAVGKHLRTALPFTLFALTGVAYFQAGTILVSVLAGHAAAAAFQVGFMLFQGAMMLPDTLATAAYPRLSHAFVTDRAAFRQAFAATVRRLGVVGLVGGIALAVGGPIIVHALYRADFAAGARVILWLALAFLLRCLNYAYGTGLHAGNGERARAWNNAISLGAIVVIGGIAAARWGAEGMAAAFVMTEAILLACEFFATRTLRREATA